MALTTVTLGGTTLPGLYYDGGYTERKAYRGAAAVMVDGSINVDLVATGAKRNPQLTWTNIDEDDKDTVDTALAAVVTNGYAELVTPNNETFNVTLDENLTLPTWTSILAAGGILLWSGSVTLREV